VAASVLVGRVEELAALDAAWERAGQGQPATVLIGGEAGVGKSRLAEEFGARARAAGAVRVLAGYCLDLSAEGGLPFAPFTGMLRELVRDLGADGVAALLSGQGARSSAPGVNLPIVLAARSAIVMIASPLGTATGGPIVATLGAAWTLTASGAATIALAVIADTLWTRRRLPGPAEPDVPAKAACARAGP